MTGISSYTILGVVRQSMSGCCAGVWSRPEVSGDSIWEGTMYVKCRRATARWGPPDELVPHGCLTARKHSISMKISQIADVFLCAGSYP